MTRSARRRVTRADWFLYSDYRFLTKTTSIILSSSIGAATVKGERWAFGREITGFELFNIVFKLKREWDDSVSVVSRKGFRQAQARSHRHFQHRGVERRKRGFVESRSGEKFSSSHAYLHADRMFLVSLSNTVNSQPTTDAVEVNHRMLLVLSPIRIDEEEYRIPASSKFNRRMS